MGAANVKNTAVSPGAKTPGERPLYGKKAALLGITALFLWSCALCAASLYFTAEASVSTGAALRLYLRHFVIIPLNLLPVMLTVCAVYLFSNRVWLSAVISGALFGGLTLSNYYKLLLRGDPLFAVDLSHFTEAADMVSGTGTYELIVTKTMLLAAAILAAAFVCCLLFAKYRLPISVRSRIALGAAAIAVFAALVPTLYASGAVYDATNGIVPGESRFNFYSDADQYASRGVVYSFLHSASNASAKKPDGFNKNEARELLSQYINADIPENKKVSVLAVMLEAFNDFSKFGLEFNDDPYECFHALQRESVTGTLVTNIFAGGTTDTERAFLTGFSEFYEFRKSTPSLASYFNAQGYSTVSAHPGYGWFYNRRNVNGYFGFEDSYFIENRYENTGYLYNDSGFFGDLCDMLSERTEDGRPCFCFGVTYQNHGPYEADVRNGAEIVNRGGLSEAAYNILNNYLSGIDKTDRAIGELADRLRNTDEPVVLLLFGDHNPWMGDFSFVFSELGVNLDRDTEDGFYNYYETPYVIWANDAAKKILGNGFSGDGGSFSPMLLGEKLFELCSWDGNALMGAQREMKSAGIDVIHTLGLVRENGELTKEPSDGARKLVENYLKMQYYLRKEWS